MIAAKVRIATHALLFLLAVVVFYLGLGLGLQFNPLLGTLLWLVAASIVALHLIWILQWHFSCDK